MKSLSESIASQFSKAWVFTVIKPGFEKYSKDIIDIFKSFGWKMTRIRTKQLTKYEAKKLYAVHKKEDFYDDLCTYMASDISVGVIYEKPGKICKSMFEEVDKIKDKIRKKWGKDDMRNVLHSSDSLSSMEQESQIYF